MIKINNLIITNNIASISRINIQDSDLIIEIYDSGTAFGICKNRWGGTTLGMGTLPIAMLPQVLAKPDGHIMCEWH